MSTDPLIGLWQRVRPELACLGELGRPLLEVVTLLERLAGMSSTARLSSRRSRSTCSPPPRSASRCR